MADIVFGTAELLEEVLRHLSPLDIVNCMRVSKSFHHCISASPFLQEQLCLRIPKQAREQWLWHVTDEVGGEYKRVKADEKDDEASTLILVTPAQLCPALSRIDRRATTIDPFRHGYPVASSDMANFVSSKPFDSLMEPPWGDMHLTNPPCYHASMLLYYENAQGISVTAYRELKDQLGLTMSKFLSHTHDFVSRVRTTFPPGFDYLEQSLDGTSRTSVTEQIRRLEQTYGGKFLPRADRCAVRFVDMLLPTEEERRRVGDGARK
jgi:hypothetical protein